MLWEGDDDSWTILLLSLGLRGGCSEVSATELSSGLVDSVSGLDEISVLRRDDHHGLRCTDQTRNQAI